MHSTEYLSHLFSFKDMANAGEILWQYLLIYIYVCVSHVFFLTNSPIEIKLLMILNAVATY